MRRRTAARIATAAGAAAAVVAVVAVMRDAGRDRIALDAATSGIDAFRSHLAAGALDRAGAELRAAIDNARPVLDGPFVRHAWSRAGRRGELDGTRSALADALGTLEAAVEARRSAIDRVAALGADVRYATTLAELDAVESRRAAAEQALVSETPAAHALLVEELAARRMAFRADVERNGVALASMRRAHELAVGDAAALQAVVDSVLPAPPRAGEGAEADAIRRAAAAERADLLIAGRLESALAKAASAGSAAEAANVAESIGRDPALQRDGDRRLADRVSTVIAALREREARLRAWESTVRQVDDALAADEPAAAARALARLEPCDERTAAEAGRIRAGFGGRVLDCVVRRAIGAIDDGDAQSLLRAAASVAPGGSVRPLLPAAAHADADRLHVRLRRSVDRELYEQFRRSPSAELAARYLDGWPGELRAMAPAVLAWRRAAAEAGTTVRLAEIRWGALGTAAVSRGLEDRPDATVGVFVNGVRTAEFRVADVRDGASNGINDVVCLAPGFPWDDLEIGVLATVDLRDAILSDPRTVGAVRQPAKAWRADRVTEIVLLDPAWPASRHRAVLRSSVPKTPPLPPFQGRQQ
jgi:hypothetical protein